MTYKKIKICNCAGKLLLEIDLENHISNYLEGNYNMYINEEDGVLTFEEKSNPNKFISYKLKDN